MKPNVIIALSFGTGNTNKEIAKTTDLIHSIRRKPIILQKEIADCSNLKVYKQGLHMISNHRIKGKYLDTYEFFCQAVKICKTNIWKKAVIVAHKDHLWRCKKIAEKLGLTVMPLSRELRKFAFTPDKIYYYDKTSAQWWTRNKYLWWLREIPAIVFHKLNGWI